jgi:hypothetical protein
MTNAEYASPDGLLRFLVQTADDGVVCLGFDGYLWHRHAQDLAAAWGISEHVAVERYVQDLLENRLVIAVARVGGRVTSVNVTENPVSETHHIPPGMSVELRYWNGTPYTAPPY